MEQMSEEDIARKQNYRFPNDSLSIDHFFAKKKNNDLQDTERLKEESQCGHFKCLENIFKLKLMGLFIEPLDKLVPHIIQIERLSSL